VEKWAKVRKVTYLQIAPKSQSEIPEYADIEREIGAAAGRINGAYGEADWTPIRYVNRAVAPAQTERALSGGGRQPWRPKSTNGKSPGAWAGPW
jgi:trehalose-6-phosphate synthase